MTKDSPACQALAARQLAKYLELRRKGRHLFAPQDKDGLPHGDGKQYIPTGTKPLPIVIQESKVLRLRRKT